MSQNTQVNLKEKTVDELKVFAWDLRSTLDAYTQAYQAVVTELNSRNVPAEATANEPEVLA